MLGRTEANSQLVKFPIARRSWTSHTGTQPSERSRSGRSAARSSRTSSTAARTSS